MENERLLRSPQRQREQIRVKCNISYTCTTSGLIQIVALMLPFLAILFVTIQIKDESLIDMSNKWVILQFALILSRLLPFLFYDVEEPYYFKRTMTFYELGMTIAVLLIYVMAIPFLYSKEEPRFLNVMRRSFAIKPRIT
ncbi:uncharacterized protein LOC117173062 isoform X2 [Belonocnema kinseyi]|uniref:uncharacterized protein LOC117173062 isoform X2 n=1 Tax=Belonocnema kinseyi TaxID=2817044 RepID=UPI00143DF82B|nr:uncharacterized protein LOC117173062 isoform X2 [Belonocnema kinseyi]